ncbi:MAG TPA: peptidoglycan-binding protein [Stellaceae bacterium]|nr:peptidoglycan-binding protein [Stellaceae bacterium]
MPRITISYRREDSGVITGRIFDRLVARYGRDSIFRDIDNIPLGVDFRQHINHVLDQSDIVLAIVGPQWIGPRRGQSRLANEADPVRVEIEAVLRRDVPLIPVLVLRASMPQITQLPDSLRDFAYRNGIQVDSGQDFDQHIGRLIRAMDTMIESSATDKRPASGTGFGAQIHLTVDALQEPTELLAPAVPVSAPPAPVAAPAPRPVAPPPPAVVREPAAPHPAPAPHSPAVRGGGHRALIAAIAGLAIGAAVAYGVSVVLRPVPSGDADREIVGLRADLASARKQAAEAQDARDSANRQATLTSGRLADAEARADKAEADLASAKKTEGAQQTQIDQLTAQLNALRGASAAPAAASPAAAPPPASAAEMELTTDQKRELQRALRVLGLYQGDADGGFGAGTQEAIRQFQSFAGTPQTGTLTASEHKMLLSMGQGLSALLDQPATSPEGVAAASIKGGDQRYARAWNYDNGKGVRADPAEAAYWYALAASDGNAKAYTNLGTLVAQGWAGTKADPAGARLLWWGASARGEAIAMYDLGVLYERGIGVTADTGLARAWYQRAADHNHPDARAALKRLGG